MRQEEFINVTCSRCGVKHPKTIRAWTMRGAITKATVQCDGIVHTEKGPAATLCASAHTRENLERFTRK